MIRNPLICFGSEGKIGHSRGLMVPAMNYLNFGLVFKVTLG